MTDLQFKVSTAGKNGHCTMQVLFGDELRFSDKIDLSSDKSRSTFALKVHERFPAIDVSTIETQLLGILKSKTSPTKRRTREIDPERLIRHERFITPEVCGISVPVMVEKEGAAFGTWKTYLQLPDGTRQMAKRKAYIKTATGKWWLWPEPASVTPSLKNRWSAASRKKFLHENYSPDPVEVFHRMTDAVNRFIDFSHGQQALASLVSIYAMLSFSFRCWPAIGYLHLTGPAGSGKTRLSDVIGRMAFNCSSTSNTTAPNLFREIHSNGGLFIVDEIERLNSNDPAQAEVQSILLGGYRKGAYAGRQEPMGNGKFRSVNYDIYCPKVLACINTLPPTLATRCIRVPMFRSLPGSETVKKSLDENLGLWQGIQNDLHCLALSQGTIWQELTKRHDCVPKISGRQRELWQPILSIAEWLDSLGAGKILPTLQQFALDNLREFTTAGVPEDDETLLKLLAKAVCNGERPTCGEILERAKSVNLNAFSNWSERHVSNRLQSYHLTPKKVGSRREFREVDVQHFRQIQSSYHIDLNLPDA